LPDPDHGLPKGKACPEAPRFHSAPLFDCQRKASLSALRVGVIVQNKKLNSLSGAKPNSIDELNINSGEGLRAVEMDVLSKGLSWASAWRINFQDHPFLEFF
jgi:hypothetical protein